MNLSTNSLNSMALSRVSECPGSQGKNSGILSTIIAEYGMRASG